MAVFKSILFSVLFHGTLLLVGVYFALLGFPHSYVYCPSWATGYEANVNQWAINCFKWNTFTVFENLTKRKLNVSIEWHFRMTTNKSIGIETNSSVSLRLAWMLIIHFRIASSCDVKGTTKCKNANKLYIYLLTFRNDECISRDRTAGGGGEASRHYK